MIVATGFLSQNGYGTGKSFLLKISYTILKIIFKNYFHHSADHDGIVVHISGEHSDVVARSNIVDHSRTDHGSLDICVRSWGGTLRFP